MRRLRRNGVGVFLGLLIVATGAVVIFYISPAGWSTNDVTTGKHPGYPDLQPRRYDMPPDAVIQFAATAASRLRGWKVTRTDVQKGTMHADVTTFVPLFTDDVEVTVHLEGRISVVTIRAHSRVGGGDLGENARHIRALQAAMDERLPLSQ